MKALLVACLGAALTAQSSPPQQSPKVPGEPSPGVREKRVEPPLVKTPLAPSTATTSPGTTAFDQRSIANKPVADAAISQFARSMRNLALPQFDVPTESGPIWALGSDFKASFDNRGWAFIAQPAAGGESQPLGLRVLHATVAGRDLPVRSGQPVRNGQRIDRDCGSFVESVDVTAANVQQTFTFAALPTRDELVVSMAVDSSLFGEDLGDGVAFRSPTTSVNYSEAVAIDADGNRCVAPTTFANGIITISVPATFLATAKLPLVIDPYVANVTAHGDTVDLGEPDVAWDESNLVWAVSYQRQFSASDWDMYIQLLDTNLNLVGAPITIDFTGSRWQNGRIANLGAYDRFLVVAEVRLGTNPVKVSGRTLDMVGTVAGTQFDIATSTVDELHPDVGGDSEGAPTYWTVVWEHAFSATDHDIYARQVQSDTVLRGTGPTFIQTNTTNQTWPSISKSDGAAPYADQRFTIIYQQTFNASDEDIYGSMLTWDGQFVTVAGNNTFLIEGSGNNDVLPEVSSPTRNDATGLRKMLAVFERTNASNGDIAAVAMDQAGNWQGSGDLSVLENSTRLLWPQYRPSVDSDGARFAVTYHERFSGTGNDLDTRITLVGAFGFQLVAQESGVTLGFSGNPEFNVKIASRYSGAGFYHPRYCTTNDRDGGATPFSIDAYTYDGYAAGGVSMRSTACGVLPILVSGQPLIGGSVSFDLQAGFALAGYIVGLPANIPIAPCPGCVLGANGNSVIGNLYTLSLPLDPGYVGVTLSVQGFVFAASGPCLGQIRVSDTADLTIQ